MIICKECEAQAPCQCRTCYEDILFCFCMEELSDSGVVINRVHFNSNNLTSLYEFTLTKDTLDFHIDGIMRCSYHIRTGELIYYFEYMLVDSGLLDARIDHLHKFLKYDAKVALVEKKKVVDVESFLSNRKRTLDESVIPRLKRHGISIEL